MHRVHTVNLYFITTMGIDTYTNLSVDRMDPRMGSLEDPFQVPFRGPQIYGF
jgi:hypothetical protein